MATPATPGTADELQKKIDALTAQYQTYNITPSYTDRAAAVNSSYDAAKAASVAPIESAYQQSLLSADAARAKIPETYQAQANSVASTASRNRLGFNEAANASGLNVGAGSQVALAQNTALQNNLATVRTNEANALSTADAQRTALDADYQAKISAAISRNEYERASALYSEYKNAASDLQAAAKERASTLAGAGDFSGYAALGYTDEQVAAMQKAWIAKNPALAANLGLTGGSSGAPSPAPSTSTATTPATTPTSAGYSLGELRAAAAAGYTSDQIMQALLDNGVTITPSTPADIAWARSK